MPLGRWVGGIPLGGRGGGMTPSAPARPATPPGAPPPTAVEAAGPSGSGFDSSNAVNAAASEPQSGLGRVGRGASGATPSRTYWFARGPCVWPGAEAGIPPAGAPGPPYRGGPDVGGRNGVPVPASESSTMWKSSSPSNSDSSPPAPASGWFKTMVNPPSSSSSSSSPPPPPPPFASPAPAVGAAVLVNVGGCVPSSAPANAAACDAAAIAADSASTLRRGCPPSWVCCGESNAQTAHGARECTRSTSETRTRRRTHLAVQLVVIVLLHQLCSSCVGGAGGHKVLSVCFNPTARALPRGPTCRCVQRARRWALL